MKREQLAYAVWSWGLQEREQLEMALRDIREADFHNFESVYLTIDLFMDEEIGFKKLIKKYDIEFTHLKDVRRKKQGEQVAQAAGWNQTFEIYSDFLELGCGDTDLPGVFAVLDKIGYNGYLALELDKAPVSNRESVFHNMAYTQKALEHKTEI